MTVASLRLGTGNQKRTDFAKLIHVCGDLHIVFTKYGDFPVLFYQFIWFGENNAGVNVFKGYFLRLIKPQPIMTAKPLAIIMFKSTVLVCFCVYKGNQVFEIWMFSSC